MKKYTLLFFLSFTLAFSIKAQVAWNMELLSEFDDNTIPDNGDNQKAYNDIWGYAAEGREYAIVGSAAYIHFFDITDPYNPVLVNQFAGGDTTVWRDIKTYGNYAYSVSDDTDEGMMIFDLSTLPDSVSLVSQSTEFFKKAHNIFIDEFGKLFVAGSDALNNGLIVLDLTANALQPALIGNDTLIAYVHDVYVRDNIAYCSHGNPGLYIWDYTDAAEPVLLAGTETNAYNHSSWLSEDGSYLIFAEEVPKGFPLGIMDLNNLQNGFIEVDNYFQFPLILDDDVFNTAHNPYILGDYAYVSYYEDGVQVIDLSDPSQPTLAGYYDTFPNNTNYAGYFGCWGVYPYLPSGNIIATDRKYGLHVLRFEQNVSATEDLFGANAIDIFPNPSADGFFNLMMNEAEGDNFFFEVFEVSGKKMFEQVISGTSENLNLSFLENGFYFAKITTRLTDGTFGKKSLTKKLVVSK